MVYKSKMVKIYTVFKSVLTFIMNVDYLQDTVNQDPAHLYNYSSKNCPHFNHLTLLYCVNFVYKVTDMVLRDTAFALMMILEHQVM